MDEATPAPGAPPATGPPEYEVGALRREVQRLRLELESLSDRAADLQQVTAALTRTVTFAEVADVITTSSRAPTARCCSCGAAIA
jgi:type II secretory pathway component PulM